MLRIIDDNKIFDFDYIKRQYPQYKILVLATSNRTGSVYAVADVEGLSELSKLNYNLNMLGFHAMTIGDMGQNNFSCYQA